MSRFVAIGGLLAALVAGPAFAETVPPYPHPGQLTVNDQANLFTAKAEENAKEEMKGTRFKYHVHFTVETFKVVPAERLSDYNSATDKNKYVLEWAKANATGDKAKGPYVLIVLNPSGHTQVVLDAGSRSRGHGDAEQLAIARIFDTAMKEAAGKPPADAEVIRDKALLDATDYVRQNVAGTKPGSAAAKESPSGDQSRDTEPAGSFWSSTGGWICIGLCVLLGVWLIVGLIRAFTAPPGAYGGGGFGTALLGGLFGAMAGMWLYNSFFSGSEASAADAGAGASDAGAGGGDTGGATDTGGDYGGGGDDLGGDYGGGDVGGDFGGGGDF
jgi:uncharacterized protein